MRGGIHADYIDSSLCPNRRATKVKEAVETLREVKFDAIAVRGMSGAIIGGAIAHELSKPIILVRKDDHEEAHHSCMDVEGPIDWAPPARYVIVDDFVSSGNTLRRIQDKIGAKGNLIGAYLYRDREFTSIDDFPERWLLNYEGAVPEVPFKGERPVFMTPIGPIAQWAENAALRYLEGRRT